MHHTFGTATTRGGVQSVDRALDLIEALAESGRALGLSELADLTGLPEGTVHRLLRALVVRGYVRQGQGRKYALGSSVLRLRDAGRRMLSADAAPSLQRLVELSGETANLAVLEGDLVVYVAQAPSPRALRMFAEVGRRVHPHSTAVGKVLLADRDEAQVRALLSRTGMAARTPVTLTDPDAFVEALRDVRALRYAVDDGEEEVGVRCVAVPVLGPREEVVAAVSVSGPAERIALGDVETLAGRMRAVADDLARTLSGHDLEEHPTP